MANWAEILNEINRSGSTHDVIRRQYVENLHNLTGRNTILYYSGWLQKPNMPGSEINDSDKNGFMNCIHNLEKNLGLDLILHTPGGETAATESLVDYLRSVFGTNIRAIIPQLAMSAGTMVACACKQIIMGKHSSLGPIDPQFQGLAAHGVVEEFKRAHQEIRVDPSKASVWQPIINKYPPTFIGECEKAIQWSNEMVKEWLLSGMFSGQPDAEQKVANILEELSDHALTKSHARHLSFTKCQQMGLDVLALEDDPKLQDAVLSVHHSCIHTLSSTSAYKIIENQLGIAFIQMSKQVLVQQ
mgnify:CR=1 FL=1